MEATVTTTTSAAGTPTASPAAVKATRRLTELATWQPLWRPLFGLLLVIAAYRVTLQTLLDSMRLDTPLAHLALVPMICLGLAYAQRDRDAGPPIHDRQLDWILGIALVSVALACNVVLPARLSSDFWVWRVDLLTLPLFVAGVIALLFGARTLWKYRVPVAFLFLAWPYPFNLMLDKWLGRFTSYTVWGVERGLDHVTLATRIPNSDTFEVAHQGAPIRLSVASACSGANGVIGFALVAGAFLLVVKGSKLRKLLWLSLGMSLVWTLNVVRILVIFWSARTWGERVAVDGFHPVIGLVVFNIAVLVMVLLLRPFGLRFAKRAAPTAAVAAPKPYRPSVLRAGAFIVVAALAIGVYNGDLRAYDRIADSLGGPRLTTFSDSKETPPGWRLMTGETMDWSKRFFGDDSVWTRYTYSFAGGPVGAAGSPATGAGGAAAGAAAPLSSNTPMWFDVIDTSDRAALSAYGVEQCYSFHGYAVTGKQSVDLGYGVTAGVLSWTNGQGNTYTSLYWHWPIKKDGKTRYERMTMIINDQPTNQFTSPKLDTPTTRKFQLDINDVLRGVGSTEDRQRLLDTRQFMVAFAHELISMRAPAPTS